MAMNKAEQALVESLRVEAAFRWPTAAEPKPMTRDEIQAAFVDLPPSKSVKRHYLQRAALGWSFNAYSASVDATWSTGSMHGSGHEDNGSATQGMARLYRTQVDACVAMRWAMCREFAKKLRSVDAQIECVTSTGEN